MIFYNTTDREEWTRGIANLLGRMWSTFAKRSYEPISRLVDIIIDYDIEALSFHAT